MKRYPHPAYFVLLALLGIILVLPFIAFAMNAFSFRWFFPQFVPQEWSLQAWQRIFNARSQVPLALWNSTVIAVGVTFSALVIGLPAARALGMYDFRGKRSVEFLILAPTMVPPIAVSMGLSINFLRLGLGGTLFGVGLVHLVPVMPYVVLTLAGVFANYDIEHEEQARTLGAGTWSIFRHITLPAILPGIVVAGLFAFLISWSQYVLTFIVGGGRVLTMPILLFSAVSGVDNANTAAQALLFVGPAILVLLITSRYLSQSNTGIGGFGRV